MHPFRFKLDTNVLHAQAYGCWLYLQVGDCGLFCGSHMPCGVRLVWNRPMPRFRFIRHDPGRIRKVA